MSNVVLTQQVFGQEAETVYTPANDSQAAYLVSQGYAATPGDTQDKVFVTSWTAADYLHSLNPYKPVTDAAPTTPQSGATGTFVWLIETAVGRTLTTPLASIVPDASASVTKTATLTQYEPGKWSVTYSLTRADLSGGGAAAAGFNVTLSVAYSGGIAGTTPSNLTSPVARWTPPA